MPKYIAYHGTTRLNAIKIAKKGFKVGTYFAKHLEDALEYGQANIKLVGTKVIYIFGVMFDSDKHHIPDFVEDHTKWQFKLHEHLSSARIVKYFSLEMTVFYTNEKLRNEIADSNPVIKHEL